MLHLLRHTSTIYHLEMHRPITANEINSWVTLLSYSDDFGWLLAFYPNFHLELISFPSFFKFPSCEI